MIAVTVRVGRFAATIEATRATLFLAFGPWEAWAQLEDVPSPFRVTCPTPGQRLYDFRRWSLALTDFRSFKTATA